MKKLKKIFLAVSVLALLLTACGGETDKNDKATSDNTDSVTSTKDSITIAVDADVNTFHPSDYATNVEHSVINQIYDRLFVYKTVDGERVFEPKLAEKHDISDDGLTYTFYLKEGVTFHDGSPLTAEDVKFTLELYQKSNYQGASAEGIADIQILDDLTIQITTDGPYAPFMENLERIYIASKSYYETATSEEFADKPVGTGAYKFVNHNIGSNIELEANEDYFLGAAKIKTVNFRVIADNVTNEISLQTNEVDFARIKESSYTGLKDVAEITIENVPDSGHGFISLNHEKEPFNNLKFRQAIAYAIDRQNLIDLALNGIGTVNSNIISPLRFGYSDDLPVYEYNPEKAKELLKEAGIETPYDLGVMPVAEQYSTQAQVIQNDLAAVGINCQIEILEFNALLDKMFKGDVGITTLAIVLDGSTQQYSLALTTPYVGAANNGRYSNPKIDELFALAEKTVDDVEREKIYIDIFTKVQEDVAYVILYNKELLFAYNNQLVVPQIEMDGYYYIHEFEWK